MCTGAAVTSGAGTARLSRSINMRGSVLTSVSCKPFSLQLLLTNCKYLYFHSDPLPSPGVCNRPAGNSGCFSDFRFGLWLCSSVVYCAAKPKMHAGNDVHDIYVPFMCFTHNRISWSCALSSCTNCVMLNAMRPTLTFPQSCWQACNANNGAVMQTEAHLNMHV